MDAYLLTWNPDNWSWDDRAANIEECRTTGKHRQRWSCGNRTSLPIGSRVFLLQQGRRARGIIGAGSTYRAPFKDAHWDRTRRERGEKALYVGVEFNFLADAPLIDRSELDAAPFAGTNWNPQGSGVEIAPSAAAALERLWAERTASPYPDDLPPGAKFTEGAARTVTVNAYERNPAARAACLAHHGSACCVCGMTFEEIYGSDFKGGIHVHHLTPISALGKSYEVDPIKDLRPVCPNCHAALHQRTPPYAPEELKRMLRSR